MEPDKFRESRQEINRMCKNVHALIDQKALDESKAGYEKVHEQLKILKPQAEGEIQKRSVKNLGLKLKNLSTLIHKLKPKAGGPRKKGKTGIIWDESRLAQLAAPFLEKLLQNMETDDNAAVCLGTTGKGIRPNYQIHFSDKTITSFSGSSHKPSPKPNAGQTKNISPPFSRQVIENVLAQKNQ
ncbi:MAG: hypothetical protein K9K21_09265 [Desulfotignum sp.]|nr:hypothetical protein [Desulfotignum sp.]MCF8114022.1 hypothetical protein [Desulfotignum sp.]MCF8125467.1 hypothetical protein [Desulfotignum sp.]